MAAFANATAAAKPNSTSNNIVLTKADRKEYAVPAKLDLSSLGLTPAKKKYSFIVMADPQGGNPDVNNVHGRIGPTIEATKKLVESINRDPVQPEFVVIVGDIVDDEGETEHFEAMHSILGEIDAPILYAMGNHETHYTGNATMPGLFDPGNEEYNFQLLSNFLLAQKKMSGINRICYSFDVGDVHFIVFPNPMRPGFFETYPCFEWLEQDLRAHKGQPVVFFHHTPVVPTGHADIVSYSEAPAIKRRIVENLAAHGNVKYAMSGHEHIPFKSSVKTAKVYNGTTYINLPSAGIGSRYYGEPDIVPHPTVGYAVVDVDGTEMDLKLKHFDHVVNLPKLSEFNPDDCTLWFYEDWELPASDALKNGDFSEGLKHWSKYFIYQQDRNPSITQNIIRDTQKTEALELYVGKDNPYGNAVTFNRVSQMINWQGKDQACLNFAYKINAQDFMGYAGGVVSVALYRGQENLGKIVYCFGMAYHKLDGLYSSKGDYFHYNCHFEPDVWNSAQINLAEDIAKIQRERETRLSLRDADKLKITLQAWTDGKYWETDVDSQIRIQFADVELSDTDPVPASSFADQKPVLLDRDQVIQGITHYGAAKRKHFKK
jgi:3',5'-cyclic AMP phosphodiesterase CpdA